MVLQKLDILMQKYEYSHRPNTFHEKKSIWTINLNLKQKTTMLLEDGKGKILGDLKYGDYFPDTTPKAQFMKGIINKSWFVKDIVKKMKIHAKTEGKYFQNTYLIKDYYTKYTKNS